MLEPMSKFIKVLISDLLLNLKEQIENVRTALFSAQVAVNIKVLCAEPGDG